MKLIKVILIFMPLLASCSGPKNKMQNQNTMTMETDSTNTYAYNRDFLKKHVDIIELKKGESALILVPEWQGRVMTSTSEGEEGFSFGWINRTLIASGEKQDHINAFGGEERLWLGPEGGQFSIFFSKGKSFIFDDWQTPSFIDTDPFELISKTDSSALLIRDITLENYSGTKFKFRIGREVIIMSEQEIIKQTELDLSGLKCIAYRSNNTITNNGENEWKKESGLLSIWMLGMFNPSPSVVVVIPVKTGDENVLGPKVKDNYFGKIPGDRLKVSDSHIFFRADGKSRGKLGIPPPRAIGTMGSFDPDNKILTLLFCRLPEGINDYVNSSWEIQDDPFSGDVLNSYNDGPLDDGSQMGPFYELETSSPAAKLKPGESLSHIQFTLHLTGDLNDLNRVTRKILGVSIDEITGAF